LKPSIPVGKPVQNVANDRAGRRGDDADHRRQMRQQLLARFVEQSLGGKPLLALLEQRHERAEPGGLQRIHHDLVLRAPGIGGQPAGDGDLETGFELELDALRGAAPDHAGDAGALVLEIEINVPVRVIADLPELAAHPHIAIGILDRALERRRKLGDGQFRQIEARLVHCSHKAVGRMAANGPHRRRGSRALDKARRRLAPGLPHATGTAARHSNR
jgi:hypothetical protein